MPTIFAIDGAEDSGFGDFGAYSSGVASLQTALIALGQKVGDSTLSALVLDGLIGPKTTAAANRAFTNYVSNGPNFATGGAMSQSQVASAAEELATFVKGEVARRSGGAAATTARATPGSAPPAALAPVSDTSAQIVKYAAIGLGGVIVASLLYWMYRRSQGRPVFGDYDFGADEPSQRDMFYRAGRQRAEADQVFLQLVRDGLTRVELQKLIDKRPSVWGKYRNWLDTLPKRHGVGPDRFKGSLGGGSTRKYNAIAQVTGKTRDGWSTSWGLRSVTGIEASSESEARRAAMAIWRKRGEWPERGKRYNPKSLRLHVTVAEGY